MRELGFKLHNTYAVYRSDKILARCVALKCFRPEIVQNRGKGVLVVRGFVSGLVVAVLLGVGSCSGVVAEGEASNRSVVSAGQVPWESAYLDRVKVESMTDRAGCQWMRLKDSTRPTNGVYDEGHCEGMGAIRLKVPALKGVRFNVTLRKTAGGRPFQVVYLDPLGGVIHGKFGFSDSMELNCQKYAWNPASGGCYVGIEYDASLWDRSGKLAIEIAVASEIPPLTCPETENAADAVQGTGAFQEIGVTETNDWLERFRIYRTFLEYCGAMSRGDLDPRSLIFVDNPIEGGQTIYALPYEQRRSVDEFPPFGGDVYVRAPMQYVDWLVAVSGNPEPIELKAGEMQPFPHGTVFQRAWREDPE